jgi:hypothetical protein
LGVAGGVQIPEAWTLASAELSDSQVATVLKEATT